MEPTSISACIFQGSSVIISFKNPTPENVLVDVTLTGTVFVLGGGRNLSSFIAIKLWVGYDYIWLIPFLGEYCVSFTSTLKSYIVYAVEAEEEHKPLKPVHSRPLPSCKLLYTCSWLFTLNCTVTFRQQESSLLGYILGALCLRQIANVLFQFCSSGVFQNISFILQTVKEVRKSKTFLIDVPSKYVSEIILNIHQEIIQDPELTSIIKSLSILRFHKWCRNQVQSPTFYLRTKFVF